MSVRASAGDRLSLAAFRAGWSLVRHLPPRAAYRSFDVVADATYRKNGKGVRRLRANYERVRPDLRGPELEAVVRAGVRSYMRYWCEAFRVGDQSREELVSGVRAEGDDAVRAQLTSGRGVACFLGHLGNWDTGGAWSTYELAPVHTVAERLRPEELYEEFLQFRRNLGMTIYPLTGGGELFRTLVADARKGALVALLADRDLTDGGVTVDFCGHPARMAIGPAAVAINAGVPLVPTMLHYEPHPAHPSGHRLVIRFHAPVVDPGQGTSRQRIQAMTQACADILAQTVQSYPQDWHMMQRVFAEDLADPAGPADRAGAS